MKILNFPELKNSKLLIYSLIEKSIEWPIIMSNSFQNLFSICEEELGKAPPENTLIEETFSPFEDKDISSL